MTDRRTWSIAVKFARQTNGQVRYSSTHWSPPREGWPHGIQAAVQMLRLDMAKALEDN